MPVMCEVCHKKEATGTIYLDPWRSPIHVGGIYRVCEDHGGPKQKKDKRDWGENI